jgi:hypothetical protein
MSNQRIWEGTSYTAAKNEENRAANISGRLTGVSDNLCGLKDAANSLLNANPTHPCDTGLPISSASVQYMGCGNASYVMRFFRNERFLNPDGVSRLFANAGFVYMEHWLLPFSEPATWWDGSDSITGPFTRRPDYSPFVIWDVHWEVRTKVNPIWLTTPIVGRLNSSNFAGADQYTLLCNGPKNVVYDGDTWNWTVSLRYRPDGWYKDIVEQNIAGNYIFNEDDIENYRTLMYKPADFAATLPIPWMY